MLAITCWFEVEEGGAEEGLAIVSQGFRYGEAWSYLRQ